MLYPFWSWDHNIKDFTPEKKILRCCTLFPIFLPDYDHIEMVITKSKKEITLALLNHKPDAFHRNLSIFISEVKSFILCSQSKKDTTSEYIYSEIKSLILCPQAQNEVSQ